MSANSGQLLTPSFFDDCEGVISVNGIPVVDFSPIMSELDTGGATNRISIDAFCEKLKLSRRFVTDPYAWLGVKLKLGTNIVSVVDLDGLQPDSNIITITAGYWLVENLDTGEMLSITVDLSDNGLTIVYFLH